ncbi:hypothetical protein HDU82_004788 [Entophlyctis luteolus]|nr:hypothetical protein HDU82_004788 [Entophlyctis luteolus]
METTAAEAEATVADTSMDAATAAATDAATDVTATTAALRRRPRTTLANTVADETSTVDSELSTSTEDDFETATTDTSSDVLSPPVAATSTGVTSTPFQLRIGQPVSRHTTSAVSSTTDDTAAAVAVSSATQDPQSTSDDSQRLATTSAISSANNAVATSAFVITGTSSNANKGSQESQSGVDDSTPSSSVTLAGALATLERASVTLEGTISQVSTTVPTHGAGIFSVISTSDAAGATASTAASSGSLPAFAIAAIVAVFVLAILGIVVQQTRKHRRKKRIDESSRNSAWMRAAKRPPAAAGRMNSGYLGDSEDATRGGASSSDGDGDSDGDITDAYNRDIGFIAGRPHTAPATPTAAPVIVSSTIPALNALARKARSQQRMDDSDGPMHAHKARDGNAAVIISAFEEVQSQWSYDILQRDPSRFQAQIVHTASILDSPLPSAAVGFVNVEMLPDFLDLEGSVAVFSDSGGN